MNIIMKMYIALYILFSGTKTCWEKGPLETICTEIQWRFVLNSSIEIIYIENYKINFKT